MKELRSALLTASARLALLAPPAAAAGESAPDPTKAEVPLPALAGWRASLIIDNDVGIWTVGSLQVFPRFGCPEVFGLDDLGRCIILVSYSGKWTPFQTVHDGKWLGALVQTDLDPHLEGVEIYTGGQQGNLFQIRAHHEGDFDTRVVARFPGEEIHTLMGGDLLPSRQGQELLVFSRLGLVFDIRPGETPGAPFTAPIIARLDGRVRQAVALPARPGEAPWIAASSRPGKLLLLRMNGQGLDEKVIAEEPMGLGRLAIRKSAPGEPVVLYQTRDDGVLLRFEGRPEGSWKREVIYAGPQGLRGVASGRFHEDPAVETVAVFGYSKKVQLLSRPPGGDWSVETLFVDRDKGHWLAVAELDGRNSTDELIGSGYGTRIFLLSRPPGYGLKNVPVDPDPDLTTNPETLPDDDPAIKVAVRAKSPLIPDLHPLSYRGGFETKTALYETLVRRDSAGRIVPALAESWRIRDGGRELLLTLRDGARFHDGSAVDAEAVRVHLKRWVGLPEHAWLRSSDRIVEIAAPSQLEVRLRFSEPTACLPDLCAVNPCAIRAPASLDDSGRFIMPLGSGPYRLAPSQTDEQVLRLLRFSGKGPERVDLHLYTSEEDACSALLRGEVDLLADGWQPLVPRRRVPELADRFTMAHAPGSSVFYLSFRLEAGPTADLAFRRRIRGAIDRDRLIAEVESGFATPCRTWAAPSVSVWPESAVTGSREPLSPPAGPLRLLCPGQEKLGHRLAEQLTEAGLKTIVVEGTAEEHAAALKAGAYDLRVEQTWGVPYDPYISLTARFLPPPARRHAAEERYFGVDPELARLVGIALGTPDPDGLPPIYLQIQRRIDEHVSLVPLYVPDRLSVVRPGLTPPRLDHDIYRLDLDGVEG